MRRKPKTRTMTFYYPFEDDFVSPGDLITRWVQYSFDEFEKVFKGYKAESVKTSLTNVSDELFFKNMHAFVCKVTGSRP